jgi:hypothetical protein
MYERGNEPVNSALAEGRARGISPSVAVKDKHLNFLSRMSALRKDGSSIRPSTSNFTAAIAVQAIDEKLHHNNTVCSFYSFSPCNGNPNVLLSRGCRTGLFYLSVVNSISIMLPFLS